MKRKQLVAALTEYEKRLTALVVQICKRNAEQPLDDDECEDELQAKFQLQGLRLMLKRLKRGKHTLLALDDSYSKNVWKD